MDTDARRWRHGAGGVIFTNNLPCSPPQRVCYGHSAINIFRFFFISFSLLQTIVSLLLILCFFRWCRDVHLKKNETRFVFNSLYYYFDFFSLARFLLLSFLVFISWKVILTDTETIHPWLYYIYFYFLWCSSHQALFWWRNMLHYHKDYDSRNSLDTAH